MPAPNDPMTRSKPNGILETVVKGGSILPDTLRELCALLKERTEYPFHATVEVKVGALLKTIDNEENAQETIHRLLAKPKCPTP